MATWTTTVGLGNRAQVEGKWEEALGAVLEATHTERETKARSQYCWNCAQTVDGSLNDV